MIATMSEHPLSHIKEKEEKFFLSMRTLRIYSLHFHTEYTAVLITLIMLNVIFQILSLSDNWKFVSFDHFSLVPLSSYPCL